MLSPYLESLGLDIWKNEHPEKVTNKKMHEIYKSIKSYRTSKKSRDLKMTLRQITPNLKRLTIRQRLAVAAYLQRYIKEFEPKNAFHESSYIALGTVDELESKNINWN